MKECKKGEMTLFMPESVEDCRRITCEECWSFRGSKKICIIMDKEFITRENLLPEIKEKYNKWFNERAKEKIWNERQIKAIKGQIEHYRRMMAFGSRVDYGSGPQNCVFCKEFTIGDGTCGMCPNLIVFGGCWSELHHLLDARFEYSMGNENITKDDVDALIYDRMGVLDGWLNYIILGGAK